MEKENFNFSLEELLSTLKTESLIEKKNLNLSARTEDLLTEVLNKKKYLDFLKLVSISDFENAFYESTLSWDHVKTFLVFMCSTLLSVLFYMLPSQSVISSNINGLLISVLFFTIGYFIIFFQKRKINKKKENAKRVLKHIIDRNDLGYLQTQDYYNIVTYTYASNRKTYSSLKVWANNFDRLKDKVHWVNLNFEDMIDKYYKRKRNGTLNIDISSEDKALISKELQELSKKNILDEN